MAGSSGRWMERSVRGRFQSLLLGGLAPGTRYSFRLYGIEGGRRTQPYSLVAATAALEKTRFGKADTFVVSDITDSSLRLVWTTDLQFDSFLIHYAVDGSKAVRKVKVNGDLRFTVISGLGAGTTYTLHLFGVTSGQRTKPLTTTATTDKATAGLGSLSASDPTTSSVRLSWTTFTTFDSYLIQYWVQGSEERRNVTVPGGKRAYLIAGLLPSTKYTIYVYGISGTKRTQPLTTHITTAVSPTISGLTVSNVTASSLRVWWESAGGYAWFLVEYRAVGEDTRNVTVGGDLRHALLTGLNPSTRYTITLYGLTATGRSAPLTTEASTEVDPSEAMKLDALTFSQVTAGSFRITWRAEKIFESFLVVYGVRGSDVTQNVSVTGVGRFAVITGLRPGTAYTVRVYGVSASGQTKPLTTLVTTKASTEVDPSEAMKLDALTFSKVTSGSFRITWRAEKVFESFLVVYGVRGSDVTHNVSVTGDGRFAVITGLRPGTAYTVRVYGVSASGQTKPLTTLITTKASTEKDKVKPKRVVSVSVSKVTAVSLRLAWTADRGFDAFLVRYKEHGKGASRNVTVPGDRRAVNIANLRPGTKYTVYIHGMTNGQRTKPISRVIVTPAAGDKAAPAPARLGSLSDPTVTASSVRLSWTTLTTFDSYLIQYKVQGSEETRNVTVPGGKRAYLIAGLLPSTKYTIYIYGISGSKRTPPLTTHITTAGLESKVAKKPGELGTLSVSHLTPQSFKLSWTTAKGFDSFLVEYKAAGVGSVRNLTVPAARSFSFVRGLSPATVYTVHVYGLAGGQRSKPLTTQVTTAPVDTNGVKPSRLSKLIRLSGNNVTDTSLQVYWAAESGFDSFIIQYGVEGATETRNLTAAGDKQSAFISGLRPSTRYLVSLFGVSGNRQTRPLTTVISTAASLRVEQVKSILFGGLTFSNITANSLQLSWEADDVFDSFLIQYVAQGSESRSNLTLGAGRRSAYVTGLLPATNYTIYLHGVTGGKLSRPLVARLTITAVPVYDTLVSTLGGLLVSDISAHGMRLAWTVEEGAFDSFLVSYRDSMARQAARELTVPGSSHHVTIADLSPSTEYLLSLHGVLDGRRTDPIPITARTARASPKGLRFTKVTDSSVTISWSAGSDHADSYKVFYVQNKQGEPLSRSVDGTRTDITLSSLAPGARYEVNLVPVRGGVESPPILGHFTTAPDPPSQLKAVNVTQTRALLQWKAATAPVDHYVVSYKAEGAAAVRKTVPAEGAEMQLTGLRANTVYTAAVHSVQGAGRSAEVSARFTTVRGRIAFPKDCSEELSNGRADSGEVTLYLNGNQEKPIKVFCDMTTDGGGWIVFQRRMDGKVNFMRTWKEYVAGFGDITTEHWLGLDKLHQLTSQERFELRVDLRAGEQTAYAAYDSFAVEGVAAQYRLGLGKYSGTAGNSLSYHRGSNFTTIDVDNDNALTNCAISYRGGWWYQNCHRVNLNGEYGNNKDHQGVNWFAWKGFEFSIPFTEMKMRPWTARRE